MFDFKFAETYPFRVRGSTRSSGRKEFASERKTRNWLRISVRTARSPFGHDAHHGVVAALSETTRARCTRNKRALGLLERHRIRSSRLDWPVEKVHDVGLRAITRLSSSLVELGRAADQPRNHDNFLTANRIYQISGDVWMNILPCAVNILMKKAPRLAPRNPSPPCGWKNSWFIRQMRHSSAPRAGFSKFPIGQLDRG